MIRVGFHVEGPTDLTVLKILTHRLIADDIDPIHRQRRMGGYDRVRSTVGPACWDFWLHGALGAVLHVDNNGRLRHDPEHHPRAEAARAKPCRTCVVLAAIPDLPVRPDLGPLRIALAVPVAAIEAWLIAADPKLLDRYPTPETLDSRNAKRLLYRVDDLARLTGQRMLAVSSPLARDGSVATIRASCPSFDDFARAVEGWRK